MSELLPCPFCGQAAKVAPDEIGSGGQHVPPYHAGCFRAGGCGVVFTADDPDEAVAEWNRRVAPRQEKVTALLDEGLEILSNLYASIRKHGNYSPEATCTFIDQAGQCFREASRSLAALPQEPAPEPVKFPTAFCQPDDPDNSTAFSWPGTARSAKHTMALYAAPVPPVVGEDAVGALRRVRETFETIAECAANCIHSSGQATNRSLAHYGIAVIDAALASSVAKPCGVKALPDDDGEKTFKELAECAIMDFRRYANDETPARRMVSVEAYEERFSLLSCLSHPAQGWREMEGEGASVEYEIHQHGEWQAASTSYDDAMHYMAVYGQDGPVELWRVERRRLPSAPAGGSDAA